MDEMTPASSVSIEARRSAAVAAWRALLGDDRVTVDPSVLYRYGRSDVADAARPEAVVRPKTAEQVPDILRIASEHRFPIYPISRGQNWGYGAASPVCESQAILDLGDVNRIIEINEELAYAVIEPGVTLAQLYEALEERGGRLWMDCTDSSRDTSIIGNCIERGLGMNPLGDRFLNTCGMRVVLADGTTVDTGLAHYPNARAGYTFKWGVGPALDGLFTQSNYGVVTRLAVGLLPKPQAFMGWMLNVNEAKFPDACDAVRKLRLSGVVQCVVHTLLTRERNCWTFYGAIYGTAGQVAAAAEAIVEECGELGVLEFANADFLEGINRYFDRLNIPNEENVREPIARFFCGNFDLYRGVPFSYDHLRHPQRDDETLPDLGMLWLAPTCAAHGADVRAFLRMLDEVLPAEQPHTVSAISANPRTLVFIVRVDFRRSRAGEQEAATAIAERVLIESMSRGFPPYRVGIRGMSSLNLHGSSFWEVAKRIKSVLDPLGIIAPGRYEP
jgi:4-cresol dehydrogenase (hydroxylating)